MSMIYKEEPEVSRKYREEQLGEWKQLIERKRAASAAVRDEYFKPDFTSVDRYAASIELYRAAFYDMLGWPLTDIATLSQTIPTAKSEFVAEDELGKIFRLWIDVMEGVTVYGLYFIPHGDKPHPLAISQHGGGGTPELYSGFWDETAANYNNMTRRVLAKDCAVFAPQMLLWNEENGPAQERVTVDRQLNQLGGSVTAVELFKLMRALDYLQTLPEIDADRIGMIGLSYGGFYTLFMAAADTRIRTAVSSCFFNDRFRYDWPDWVWRNAAHRFMDAEICGLVCPRRLYVECGVRDELFAIDSACAQAVRARTYFDRLGISDHFVFAQTDEEHALSMRDDGIDYLCNNI
ncbi:hypothetical protein FACS1894184_02340 [Clostridia bacterium]|nr:hypothetical protein FACS1894184_02340 [Clostridia bacterium]